MIELECRPGPKRKMSGDLPKKIVTRYSGTAKDMEDHIVKIPVYSYCLLFGRTYLYCLIGMYKKTSNL